MKLLSFTEAFLADSNSIKPKAAELLMYPIPKIQWLSSLLLPSLIARATSLDTLPPQAKTLNGTYQGTYLPTYNQDVFLGIPYAQPPLGPLRYRWPQSLNTSFQETRNATSYGYSCMQYGSTFSLSEDCLTLNIIRPSLPSPTKLLPVLVWVYGGGLYAGSTADPQYNLSGIVAVSQEIGQPILAVSMNYRLGMWGFLQNNEILKEGSSNAGLLDQRMAMRWVKENVGAFGGDPEKVTVWGESAGAQSIAYHLFSYGGRDGEFACFLLLHHSATIPSNLQ